MKLQHLAIIFVIIILPISLIVGEYIQAQIDTINLQTQYSKKLQDATYDALKAFQINTINNKYSSVSDSKIRDIEASITTFYNSLGTAMGASGYDADTLKEYVPAMIYTMYDGYYIYGKYFNYNQTGSTGDYQYGLKPYIYYACRYVRSDSDFVVNYTLDNSITIYGTVNGKYITKSGYVVNPNLVGNCTYKSMDFNKLRQYNHMDPKQNDYSSLDQSLYSSYQFPIELYYDLDSNKVKVEREILTEQLVLLDENGIRENENSPVTYQYTYYKNQKIYKDDNNKNESGNPKYFTVSKNKKNYLSDSGKLITSEQYLDQDGKTKMRGEVTPLMYAIQMTDNGNLYSDSALQYYESAKEFSKWLQTNVGNITQNDAVDSNGKKIEFSSNIGSEKIFVFNDKNNPLLEGSVFNEHRMSVIRKSIETNLSTAIANYNAGSGGTYEYKMPIFTEEDWEKLLNNVSLSVFMQGIPIKSKYFNSYCIVTNNKNEEVVTESSLYVIAKNDKGLIEIHKPGCTDLLEKNYQILGAYNTTDFERQTIGEDLFFYYPQMGKPNEMRTYCYNCIVNISETYNLDDIIDGKLKWYDYKTDEYVALNKVGRSASNLVNVRKTYLTALARCRYDLYRTNGNI